MQAHGVWRGAYRRVQGLNVDPGFGELLRGIWRGFVSIRTGQGKASGSRGGRDNHYSPVNREGGVNLSRLRASAGSGGGRMGGSTSVVHFKHHIYGSKIYKFFPYLKESINSESEMFKVFLPPLKQICTITGKDVLFATEAEYL